MAHGSFIGRRSVRPQVLDRLFACPGWFMFELLSISNFPCNELSRSNVALRATRNAQSQRKLSSVTSPFLRHNPLIWHRKTSSWIANVQPQHQRIHHFIPDRGKLFRLICPIIKRDQTLNIRAKSHTDTRVCLAIFLRI